MTAFAITVFATAWMMMFSLLPCLASAQPQEKDKTAIRPSPGLAATAEEVGIGDLYAVVVGVGVYKHPKIPELKVSDKDARDFAGFLESQRRLFRNVYLTLLTNEKASKTEIEKELYYRLRKAGKDDTVIVFLSGHGADDPNTPGEFFFLSHDADPQFLMATAVHMNRQWFLNKLDSKRVVVIADACHAGGFGAAGAKSLPPSLQNFVSHFRESEGKVFVTSSRSDEYSQEMPGIGNSIFTHFLLAGLAGGADRDSDGIVTLKELYDYVYTKTKDAANGFQHPQMEGRLVGQFPLSVVHGESQVTGNNSGQASEEEIANIRERAERGESEAQIKLGAMYESGSGVRRDPEQAVLWYSRASKKGHERATKAMIRMQNEASNSDPSPLVRATISTPNPTSEYKSKKGYLGVNIQDLNKALHKKFGKSDDNGALITDIVAGGPGEKAGLKPGDIIMEFGGSLISRAAELKSKAQSSPGQQVKLKVFRDRKILYLTIHIDEKAANYGVEADDDYNRGMSYFGGFGVPKNLSEAFKWLQKAAKQGHPDAQAHIAGMYRTGHGIEQDYSLALEWARRSVGQESAYGMFVLGWMYKEGQGVQKDLNESFELFKKSAERGVPTGMHMCGRAYYYGEGVTTDWNEALKWLRKAAEIGVPESMASLGRLYRDGHGVGQDRQEAIKWFSKAAELGNEDAKKRLAEMKVSGIKRKRAESDDDD